MAIPVRTIPQQTELFLSEDGRLMYSGYLGRKYPWAALKFRCEPDGSQPRVYLCKALIKDLWPRFQSRANTFNIWFELDIRVPGQARLASNGDLSNIAGTPTEVDALIRNRLGLARDVTFVELVCQAHSTNRFKEFAQAYRDLRDSECNELAVDGYLTSE